MGIIGWILLGLVAGAIAKALLPGAQPGRLILTTLIGIGGALLGGAMARALGFGDPIDEFFDLSTWLAAVIGAVVILVIWGRSWAAAGSSPSASARSPSRPACAGWARGCRVP